MRKLNAPPMQPKTTLSRTSGRLERKGVFPVKAEFEECGKTTVMVKLDGRYIGDLYTLVATSYHKKGWWASEEIRKGFGIENKPQPLSELKEQIQRGEYSERRQQ